MNIQKLLLPFYFGSIDESERLLVERELISDTEVLLEYLDLKRSLEAAEAVPVGPSPEVWLRLKRSFEPLRKRPVLSWSLGFALAASFVALLILRSSPQSTDVEPKMPQKILFDSNNELPLNSNVL